MNTEHPRTCFTCDTPVDAYSAYCDSCIARQIKEQGDERAAFDAFHRFADKSIKHSKDSGDKS